MQQLWHGGACSGRGLVHTRPVSFLSSLENRFGGWAIPGLLKIVAIMQLVVFFLIKMHPELETRLLLDTNAVMQGELWRLISFMFIPRTFSVIWILFAVMFLFFISNVLEEAWGSFRVNLYYFTAVALLIGAAFFMGRGVGMESTLLYMSLFLAAAVAIPNHEILLFFFLPVKMKYLGMLDGAMLLLMLVSSPAVWPAVLAVLAPFFLYVGPGAIRNMRQQATVQVRRQKFHKASLDDSEPFHRCEQCGKTDKSDPHAVFRVTAGDKELCDACLAGGAAVGEG